MHDLEITLERFLRAKERRRSPKYCLKLWSRLIRERDNYRCLKCESKDGISAHHIFRKSFLQVCALDTGNGITLCRSCHLDPHKAFNGAADLDLPMDAEGGENIELAIEYLGILIDEADGFGHEENPLYHFGDEALQRFKLFQSINPDTTFPGNSLEQAALIWKQSPRETLSAVLGAMGFGVPTDLIQGFPAGLPLMELPVGALLSYDIDVTTLNLILQRDT